MNALHLGGPKYCQDDLQSNYTFDVNNSSPTINIILCGVPPPVVEGHFIGEKLMVTNSTINNHTKSYTLQLPQLKQAVCGADLIITARGYSDILTNTAKIFVKNCKYFYYSCQFSVPVLHHVQLIFFWKTFILQKYNLLLFNQVI